jgi:cytochrome c nitrite reductase small subunit
MRRYLPVAVGVVLGMVVMALVIGGYHVSAEPGACITCHSMAGDGSAWLASNHKQFACVECHMPSSGAVTGVAYKVRAGLHDLWHETLRDYPASIVASQEVVKIAQGNCIRCHRSTVERVAGFAGEWPSCTGCHRRIAHNTRRETEE